MATSRKKLANRRYGGKERRRCEVLDVRQRLDAERWSLTLRADTETKREQAKTEERCIIVSLKAGTDSGSDLGSCPQFPLETTVATLCPNLRITAFTKIQQIKGSLHFLTSLNQPKMSSSDDIVKKNTLIITETL